MSTPVLLPDSRARNDRTIEVRGADRVVPFYCASCGVEMGKAPASDVIACVTFLCEAQQNGCAEKFGSVIGLKKAVTPTEAKFQIYAQAQLECFGHYLTVDEITVVLADVDHRFTKLTRELFPELGL